MTRMQQSEAARIAFIGGGNMAAGEAMFEASGVDLRNIPTGIRVLQLAIGSPNTRNGT